MKTSLTTRLAALAASIFVTFTVMDLIVLSFTHADLSASYAPPAAPVIEWAQATRHA